MYSVIEEITPEIAQKYLEKNIDNNRKINKVYVKDYAKSMKRGEWQLTSQGITFNDKGELTDGQHRLMAIVEANIPVRMYVTYEEPSNSIIHDRGRIRGLNDVINMTDSDTQITSGNVALANCILDFATSQTAASSNVPDSTKIKFITENKEMLDDVIKISSFGATSPLGKLSSIRAAAFYALKYGIDKDTLKKFFKVLNSGFQDCKEQSAAIVVRKFVENGWKKEFSSRTRIARRRIFEVACLGINDFVHNVPRMKIYPNNCINEFWIEVHGEILKRYF